MKSKEMILTAAEKLFTENGYLQTSVDEIAKESNISKGTVYSHFPSKDQILLTIFQNHLQEVQDQFKEILFMTEASPREKLNKFISLQVEKIFTNQQFIAQILIQGIKNIKNDSVSGEFRKTVGKFRLKRAETLLDIVGIEMAEYIWDLELISLGIINHYFEFMMMSGTNVDKELELNQLTESLTHYLEGVIEKMKEETIIPIVSEFPMKAGFTPEAALADKQELKRILTNMELKAEREDKTTQTIFQDLKKFLVQTTEYKHLVIPLLNYLQKNQNLAEDASALEGFLEAKQRREGTHH